MLFRSWFLLAFHERLGYNMASLLNLVLTGGITVLLSELSFRYVEPLSRKGEVLIGRIFGAE